MLAASTQISSLDLAAEQEMTSILNFRAIRKQNAIKCQVPTYLHYITSSNNEMSECTHWAWLRAIDSLAVIVPATHLLSLTSSTHTTVMRYILRSINEFIVEKRYFCNLSTSSIDRRINTVAIR